MMSKEIVDILNRTEISLDTYTHEVKAVVEKVKFLSNEVEVLKKALLPFAKFALVAGKHWKDEDCAHFWFGEGKDKNIKMRDCREAARVLGLTSPTAGESRVEEPKAEPKKPVEPTADRRDILRYAKEAQSWLEKWKPLDVDSPLMSLVKDYQKLKAENEFLEWILKGNK